MMRALLQRVKSASVAVEGQIVGEIGVGLLLFLGLHHDDTDQEAKWLVDKVAGLRIFSDAAGKMNLNLSEVEGELLIVSQFTLYGNCMRGRRPDFISAMKGQEAEALYNTFVSLAKEGFSSVSTGRFAAHMEVSLVNDGPVTFLLESPV